MTLLVISPDYASHLLPLATLATAWQDAGESVVVATGPATADIVADFGFRRAELVLGRGSNPGVIRAEQQPPGEDEALRGFFAATRHGMVATLRYQAEARRNDLLWEPVDRARAVLDVVDRVQPDQVIVDHLAFSARLGLAAAGVPHADVVLGHPTALPVGDEVYGYPPAWPAALTPSEPELAALHRLCRDVRDDFTAEWNAALHVLAPGATPSTDAFAEHGDLLLLNYPAALHDPARTALLPPHAFLGSAVRDEPAGGRRPGLARRRRRAPWSTSASAASSPRAGTCWPRCSTRSDRSACASRWRPVPPPACRTSRSSWLLRPFLPQVALLERSALLVTHGGNNSVTEALTAGVPMVLLPFSTDQFAGAAAVEAAGLGTALDPNTATSADLTSAARAVLEGPAPHLARSIGDGLRRAPGRDVARAALRG